MDCIDNKILIVCDVWCHVSNVVTKKMRGFLPILMLFGQDLLH